MNSETRWRRAMWDAIGQTLTAHAVMLRDVPILDDDSVAALLTAIDGVRRGDPPEVNGSLALVAAFDERGDSLTAPGTAGASRIARARQDVAATAQRLVLRERLLALIEAQISARVVLIALADNHAFTLLQAWSGSTVLQPTNLAHFLTGAIAPLARAARQLQAAYEDLDRTPLGAGALTGPGLPVDREETAELLGSEGPAESTFDAIAARDHLSGVAEAAARSVAPMRLLLSEFAIWLRSDPQAIRLDDELLAPLDPGLPHFRTPAALERIMDDARGIEILARTISLLASDLPYIPAIEQTDRLVSQLAESLSLATGVCNAFLTIISGPLEFNLAWLARNAGRDRVTMGELGDFLMAEEGIDPASAREIAALTTSRAHQEGLEASAITPQMIDAAALLVIGRELGIEVERLGAYLAPRKFIEKRTMVGGPAAPAVREYLTREAKRLDSDRDWLEAKRKRIALAHENLEIRSHEILAAASSG